MRESTQNYTVPLRKNEVKIDGQTYADIQLFSKFLNKLKHDQTVNANKKEGQLNLNAQSFIPEKLIAVAKK